MFWIERTTLSKYYSLNRIVSTNKNIPFYTFPIRYIIKWTDISGVIQQNLWVFRSFGIQPSCNDCGSLWKLLLHSGLYHVVYVIHNERFVSKVLSPFFWFCFGILFIQLNSKNGLNKHSHILFKVCGLTIENGCLKNVSSFLVRSCDWFEWRCRIKSIHYVYIFYPRNEKIERKPKIN